MEPRRWQNPYIARLKNLPQYIIDPRGTEITPAGRSQIEAAIERFRDVYVEFGSGSGGHLLEQAQRCPSSLFLGFELRFKRIYRTAEKASNRGISNILVIRTPSANVSSLIADESVSGIYVNFPDPWAKRRWQKNRMLSDDFIRKIHGLLKPDCFFSYKTDHRARFDDVVNFIEKSGLFRAKRISYDLSASPFHEDNILSEFERLFISQKVPICYLYAEKR